MTEPLALLAKRFRDRGFAVRDAPFFSEAGIAVALPSDPTTALESIQVIEAMVFVYATPNGWQLRVTQHGGPHWVRDAASEHAVEEGVRDHLITRTPLGPIWREA